MKAEITKKSIAEFFSSFHDSAFLKIRFIEKKSDIYTSRYTYPIPPISYTYTYTQRRKGPIRFRGEERFARI